MQKTIGIGVVGLGRAFSLMAKTFAMDPRVHVVAASSRRSEARQQFERDFQGKAYAEVEGLLSDPRVDVVYIATPHALHARQVIAAARHGKHVLVEKPMALSPEDCRAMTHAADKAGVVLLVGHSHSFDLPILHTRKLIGQYGAVRMITALNFTDFISRRRREPLDSAVYNQAVHQVDIVRLLAGSRVSSVRAFTGAWGASRPTEGAYSCTLGFESGAFATLSYNGYGHFRSDEFMDGIGELGQPGIAHQHFGLYIVSCDKADLRPMPNGVMIYGEGEPRLDPLPEPAIPRKEVIDELYGCVVERRPPLHSGEWGAATMDVVFAMLTSAKEQREVALTTT